jgi:type VI secretion system FHA domain protein
MPLKLMISQGRGGETQTKTLDRGSLSIGRAAGNDWVLADPDQHLSRTHCMVAFEGGSYWLVDMSTNGMQINGSRESTTRDSRTVLTDGDVVTLGTYRMEIMEVADRPAAGPSAFGASNFLSERADPFAETDDRGGGGPLDVDPLADPLGAPGGGGFQHPLKHMPPSVRMSDPFDVPEERGGGRQDEDMFRGVTPVDPWKGPAQPDNAAAVSHAFSAPKATAPVNMQDIDFDALLGDVMPSAAPHPLAPPKPVASPPPPAAGVDPFEALLGDGPFGSPAAVPAAAPAPAPPAVQVPVTVAPIAVAPVVVPAVTPVVTPVVAPPPSPVATAAAVSAQVAPAASQAGPGADALLKAFLDGAGISQVDITSGDQEATMRAIGALFRAFVSGTRDVLMSRAEIKHEMRVEQTMIRSKDNNALKFSISPEEALMALLRPNRPGYKPPLASVEEAFDDIRSHEMALMAGMQTGLIALLKRFDPEGLEARLQRGMLDGIMPGARKARFWELFCSTYKDIAREAEDDFHAVFGRDFARAYNAQINKL